MALLTLKFADPWTKPLNSCELCLPMSLLTFEAFTRAKVLDKYLSMQVQEPLLFH